MVILFLMELMVASRLKGNITSEGTVEGKDLKAGDVNG